MGFFSSTKDLNIYGMDKGQRRGLGNMAFDQMKGLYGSDPGAFWGQNLGDWGSRTGLSGLMPSGGLSWEALTGRLGGGGGGGGGGRVGWSGAGSGGGAVKLDWNQEELLTRPSQQLEEAVLGKGREVLSAQTEDALRGMRDRLALTGGDSGSPAQMYMDAMLRRQQNQGLADSYRDFETSFTEGALQRRIQARLTEAQLAESARQRAMQASIANAQGRLSAAGINAGMSEAQRARDAAASGMLLGMWDKGQDRDLGRYQMLHGMNRDWQTPVGQKTMTPGWGSQLLGAASAGLGMFTGLGGLGGIKSMFGGRFNPNLSGAGSGPMGMSGF